MNILIVAILLILPFFTFGQGVTDHVLVDEFGKLSCDEFLARTDNLFIQQRNQPSTEAFYVIGGSDDHILDKLAMEQLFRIAVEQRRYDLNKVKIVRSNVPGPLKIQMWLAPAGTNPTEFQKGPSSLVLPTGKYFLIKTDNDGICNPAPIRPIARELFDANPGGFLYAVIYGESVKRRRAELNIAMKELDGFPKNRTRYILRPANGRYGSDYWFVIGRQGRKEIVKW